MSLVGMGALREGFCAGAGCGDRSETFTSLSVIRVTTFGTCVASVTLQCLLHMS